MYYVDLPPHSASHSIPGRFALNYKGIPYPTERVEYPQIAPLLTSLGVDPNPTPTLCPYTLPAIYDPRTHTALMESIKIAAYLDETYPDTPALLPPPTRAFHYVFQDALFGIVHEKLIPLLIPPCIEKLNPPSQLYLRETREMTFGCKVEELSPSEIRAEQWKGFRVLASWFEAAGDDRLLIMGGGVSGEDNYVCHADIAIAGLLMWVRQVYGEHSEEWQRVENFDGGHWKHFLNYLEKWADTSR